MKPSVEIKAGQSCWVIESDCIELSLTQAGGMMAPVSFARDTKRPIQPYWISPWQYEKTPINGGLLKTMRGDFFCLPFGENNRYRDEDHPVHGETSSKNWVLDSCNQNNGITTLVVTMETEERPGVVEKSIALRDGENVVYTKHKLKGYEGLMTLGHHQTLDPAKNEGGVKISTSSFKFGITRPLPDLYAANGEYSSILPEAVFSDLSQVPTVWKKPEYTDCSVFPAREGYCDIIGLYSKPVDIESEHSKRIGWTAAVFPGRGYLWFTLKDTAVLPGKVIWMENNGRHSSPWNGRNCCLGLEDMCGCMAEGLSISSKNNIVNKKGIETSVLLKPEHSYNVNTIQGVTRIPPGFDRVIDISVEKEQVIFFSENEFKVAVKCDPDFLFLS